MEILIQATPEKAARLVAAIVAQRLRTRPELVLGCATGRTMEGLYRELIRLHREERLDFSGC